MAIIVEDGSQVANANSYLSLADAQALIENFGYTGTLVEANLLKAMAVLNIQDYLGCRVSSSQALPFPRSGIYLSDRRYLSPTEIPGELHIAEAVLAAEISESNDPANPRTAGIIREKVDVLEVEYDPSSVVRGFSLSDFPLVFGNLRHLLAGKCGRIGRA